MDSTATEIYERVLEATGRAMLANDRDGFLPWFHIPYEIGTFEGRRVITTTGELAQVFRAVRAHYDSIGVTDMARRCVEASFQNAKTIVAMHETRLLSGNIILQQPFPTLAVLKFTGECWKVASNSYAIDGERALNSALLSAGEARHRTPPVPDF